MGLLEGKDEKLTIQMRLSPEIEVQVVRLLESLREVALSAMRVLKRFESPR